MNVMSQDMSVVNPQFNKQTLFRDIENLWYIPGIKKNKYNLTADRPCKIEKSQFTNDNGNIYTCFKISEVPDVKTVTLTLSSPGKVFGSFIFKVLPNAPK